MAVTGGPGYTPHTGLCKQDRIRGQAGRLWSEQTGWLLRDALGRCFAHPEESQEGTLRGTWGPRSEGVLLTGGTITAASVRAQNTKAHAVGAFPNDSTASKPNASRADRVPRDR